MDDDKAIPFLGILMLDTKFPRILGDAGNVDSYPVPARVHVVDGAGSLDIVKDGLPPEHLIQAFCKAAKRLESDGAFAIVSTCGFLITVQDQISDAVNVPVMMSALSLYPQIRAKFGENPIGIITASYKNLGDTALQAAGMERQDVRISGMEDCAAFAKVILQPKDQQLMSIDPVAIEASVIDKALSLLKSNPDICAFLLECTNLPPYAKAIEMATGRSVFSILDGVDYLIKTKH